MQLLFIPEYMLTQTVTHPNLSREGEKQKFLFAFSSQINLSIQVNRAAVQEIQGLYAKKGTEC